jgi:hypothetical protein
MRNGLSFRPASRVFAALLAAWMTVFAMAEVAHHHGLLPPSQDASITKPSQGSSARDVCLACLASHVPVPAAGDHVYLSVPQDAVSIVSDVNGSSLREALFAVLPSRAPPIRSYIQA